MNLFTYGSLMIPSVMHAVTGRDFPHREATLRDFARFKVKGQSYPAIIYQRGTETGGIIYLDIDAPSLERLDEFEGDLYDRISVEVEAKGGGTLAAETYAIKSRRRHLLSSEPWDLEKFKQNHLQAFLANYKGFSLSARTSR
jgi:gamma-glutamylcyclotransferase (GGCT)/AIG2-like uncharacterized protein YtfP